MNIHKKVKNIVIDCANELTLHGKLEIKNINSLVVESPKEEEHGDLSTNLAFLCVGNPMKNALLISEELKKNTIFRKIDVAKPGFINFSIESKIWIDLIPEILDENFGCLSVGGGKSVNVEFVSANPTGPIHIGHARNAVLGNTISNLLEKIGYKVTREFYINDAGKQIEILAKSLYARYEEALGIGKFDGDFYSGDYLIDTAKNLTEKYGDTLLGKDFSKIAIESMMQLIKDDLNLLQIKHDIFISESEIQKSGIMDDALKTLKEKNLIYKGTLPAPKGIIDNDWEAEEQTLFRSTKFEDDCDRAIKKSDETWTYFASDIGYHLHKIRRNFHSLVMCVGIDHSGYSKRIKAAVKALGNIKIDVVFYGLINFHRDGVPIKMSKRSGKILKISEVINEVGRDATYFTLATSKNSAIVNFDLEKVKEKSLDNPLFYIQYAYARICSVFRKAEEIFPGIINEQTNDLVNSISSDTEIQIIKLLSLWPYHVEYSATRLEPYRICIYLQNLAKRFHGYWNCGSSDYNMRFVIVNNRSLTRDKLFLLSAIKNVIKSGLGVLDIKPLESM